MENKTEDVLKILNGLIEICKDGEQGFQTATEDLKNLELKALCLRYSQQRGQFAGELREEVKRLGGDPESAGSIAGALHRGWINIKSAVTTGDEDAVISECERGEDAAKEAYEKALKAYLPVGVTGMIQRQYTQVKAAHDKFSAMQKAAR